MKNPVAIVFACLAISLCIPNNADAVIIDTFEAGGFALERVPVGTDTAMQSDGGSGDIIGGEREVTLEVTQMATVGRPYSAAAAVGSGTLTYIEDPGSLFPVTGVPGNGTLDLFYDGVGSPAGGLGGVSLIPNGETLLAFDLQSVSSTNSIGFTLSDTDSDVAVATLGPGLSTGFSSIPLSDFIADNPDIDLDSISSILISINSSGAGTPQESIRFSIIETQVVPEPSSLALLGMGAIGLFGYGWRRKKQAIVEDAA